MQCIQISLVALQQRVKLFQQIQYWYVFLMRFAISNMDQGGILPCRPYRLARPHRLFGDFED
ncbi:hypothetical protein CBW21_16890 [Chromobacterium violaceum]|uniref:Uncharacterized protein n=1 Tax=Chromobacterium violaceum TaxID=536 RepID=A0A202B5M2_CHRVL|nr:hypothetical protein CBW21_16890 [Chromobacterium violaceum]